MDETATNYDAEAKKDDGNCEYADPEPTIEFAISEPTAGATYGKDQTVHIQATVTTDGPVHGYVVYLRNKSNNDEVVFSKEEHVHESPVSIHEMWVNDVTIHSDMELEIKLITEHDSEEGESEFVSFHCHPM